MSRIVASERIARLIVVRARVVPVASTLAGSVLGLAAAGAVPLAPSPGLMMLIAWRLLRPELWLAWVGLPLGLADDLLSGRPLGTAMCLWTAILLGLEQLEGRLLWRDYWHEWALAAAALAVASFGAVPLAWLAGERAVLSDALLPLVGGVLLFPFVSRICALLDRWRLPR